MKSWIWSLLMFCMPFVAAADEVKDPSSPLPRQVTLRMEGPCREFFRIPKGQSALTRVIPFHRRKGPRDCTLEVAALGDNGDPIKTQVAIVSQSTPIDSDKVADVSILDIHTDETGRASITIKARDRKSFLTSLSLLPVADVIDPIPPPDRDIESCRAVLS